MTFIEFSKYPCQFRDCVHKDNCNLHQAVLDGLNGIRNNEYLGFRASWVTGYSDKYIVSGGNRYGYN